MFVILTILVFLLMLSVLVLIHEFGHFFMAKTFGVKVEEFGFGFPPRVFGKKKGETVYSINSLPIGGFVKLYGEDEAGGGSIKLKASERVTNEKRAFYAQSVGKRAAIVVSGVVMNAILAIIIFYIFLFLSGFKTPLPKISNYQFFGANQTNLEGLVVNAVAAKSPAEKIGITPKSRIISLNNKQISDTATLLKTVEKNRGKEILITWKNLATNEIFTKTIVPRVKPPKNEGSLGIQFDYVAIPMMVISYDTPTQKVFSGITHTANMMPWQLDAMRSLFGKAFRERSAAPVGDAVSGPVGIGFAVGSILQIPDVKVAVLQLLNLAGIMSVSLAFFNVLPIPALDGGRLFFIIVEAMTGRKVNQRIEGIIHTVGFAVLLGLIILITAHDIVRFLNISLPK